MDVSYLMKQYLECFVCSHGNAFIYKLELATLDTVVINGTIQLRHPLHRDSFKITHSLCIVVQRAWFNLANDRSGDRTGDFEHQ